MTIRWANFSKQQAKICAWSILLLAFTPVVYADLTRIPSLSQLFRLAGVAGIAILYYQFITNGLRTWEAIPFVAIASYIFFVGVLSGSFAEGLKFGILFCFISVVGKRTKVAVSIGFLSLATLALLNPVKSEYRQVVWHSDKGENMSFLSKSELLLDLSIKHWSEFTGENTKIDNGRDTTIDRINQFPVLMVVVAETPNYVPFWGGDSMIGFAYSLIPRFVWPEKPEIRTGNDFGQRYGLLHETDGSTSLNLPWLVEFYANFGWFGVIAGMFSCGVVFKWLETKFLSFQGGDRIISVLYIGLLGSLSYPESSLALMWGGVVLGSILLRLTVYIFAYAFPEQVLSP